MCWNWPWTFARPAKRSPTRDTMSQTEDSFFRRCECCHVVLALDGDDSPAGSCGICRREICYMCVSSLAWDESISKLARVCDYCRDTYLVSGFDKKYDIHELCDK